MRRVPRELFVPDEEQDAAYYDGALPIGEGQTISQPFVVATMTEALRLRGTGEGAGDRHRLRLPDGRAQPAGAPRSTRWSASPGSRRQAQETLARFGASNVHFRGGDGSLGWPEHAPYDAILVTCAAPAVPQPLVEQLADGGRMIVPVGPRGYQDLVLVRKTGARGDAGPPVARGLCAADRRTWLVARCSASPHHDDHLLAVEQPGCRRSHQRLSRSPSGACHRGMRRKP